MTTEMLSQKRAKRPDDGNVRKLAIDLFLQSKKTGKYIDRLLSDALGRSDIPSRDKKFLMELVKGVTRMQGLLNYYLVELSDGRVTNLPLPIKYIIFIGMYQLIYRDSVPPYAALNESVELSKRLKDRKMAGLVNALLRNFQRRKEEIDEKIGSLPTDERLSVRYSHPAWVIRRWLSRFGLSDTEELCSFNNSVPVITVRKNMLRNNHPRLDSALHDENQKIALSNFVKTYYTLPKGFDISSWDAIKEGEVTVQDVSAGLSVLLLDPQPGETVIDMCAAPGGKTGAIAEQMKDEGRIIAVDSDKYRLSLVEKQAERLKLRSVEFIEGDGKNISLPTADRILVDAPCSGTGVFAKRSDIRWQKSEKDIEELSSLQIDLLRNAARYLKKDGVLVYSTCTMEPEENRDVIRKFLKEHKNFKVDDAADFVEESLTEAGAVATYPFKHYIDGSYSVRLLKS